MTETVSLASMAQALGVTKRAVELRAKREGWPYEEAPARGGIQRLYLVSALPDAVRHALYSTGASAGRQLAIQARVETAERDTRKEQGLTKYLQLRKGAKTRTDARAAILTTLRAWAGSRNLKIGRVVIEEFCALYNSGQVHVEPWVHQLVGAIHPATVYRWQQKLSSDGLGGLAPEYRGQAGNGLIDRQPELRNFIVGLLTQHPDASCAHVMAACKARFATTATQLPSKRRLEVWIGNWKRENREVFLALTNPDAWKNQFMTAFGSASADVVRLNQRWELDSTPADVMLLDGRHSIIGAIDVYSRRPRLIVSRTSKATAVGQLLRCCLLEWGRPEEIKTDNGSDYTSRYICNFIASLDIEQTLCDPFAAWQKPHIERFFRTFSHDLVELLPGYIGHNVSDRQAIEARQAFSDRLFAKDQVVEVSLTAVDLQRFCDQWVERIYMHKPHEGLRGATPFERVSQWTGDVWRIRNERNLDVLLAEAPDTGIRTVTKSGLRVDNIIYIAAELALHVGKQVRVAYTESLGRVMVFNDDGFICVAEAPEYVSIDRQEVAAHARTKQREAVQEKRREMKALARKLKTKEAADEILAHAQTNVTLLPHRGDEFINNALRHAADAAAYNSPVASSPLTDDAQEALEAVKQDLGKAPAAPVVRQSPQQEYEYWLRLDRRAKAGGSLTEKERSFHAHYPSSPEYRAMKEFYDDFGGGISEA